MPRRSLPDWTRFDVGVRYAFENPGAKGKLLVARFNVDNVLDTNYWAGGAPAPRPCPGPRRETRSVLSLSGRISEATLAGGGVDAEMEPTFRASMNWLHTWAGVVLGGLLFAIFWMGTLSVFDREIDRWMAPMTRLGG